MVLGKRPSTSQKVSTNGRSHHKRSMQKTAVPTTKGLYGRSILAVTSQLTRILTKQCRNVKVCARFNVFRLRHQKVLCSKRPFYLKKSMSKRPFPLRKVSAENGSSHHKKPMRKTAVSHKNSTKKPMQKTAVITNANGLGQKRPFLTPSQLQLITYYWLF